MSNKNAEDRKWEKIQKRAAEKQAELDDKNRLGRGCDGAKVKNRSSASLLGVLIPGLARAINRAAHGNDAQVAKARRDIPIIRRALQRVNERQQRAGEGF